MIKFSVAFAANFTTKCPYEDISETSMEMQSKLGVRFVT